MVTRGLTVPVRPASGPPHSECPCPQVGICKAVSVSVYSRRLDALLESLARIMVGLGRHNLGACGTRLQRCKMGLL